MENGQCIATDPTLRQNSDDTLSMRLKRQLQDVEVQSK